MKKNIIKILTLILVLSGCNSSSSEGPLKINDLSFTVEVNENKSTTLSGFSYDEEMFVNNDSDRFNTSLARLSLGFTLANISSGNSTHDYLKELLTNKLKYKNYKAIGLEKEDDNDVGLILASKNIKFEENIYTLINCTIRSSNYGLGGWRSNFQVGSEGIYHEGFNLSSLSALKEVKGYIEENNIDKKGIKIFVNGFSRGAAVANLLSVHLRDNSFINNENIYTYGFATPRYVVKTDNENFTSYDNIYNIINSGDLVTMVAPEYYGFSRYGKDILLNSLDASSYQAFDNKFMSVSGYSYNGLEDYEALSKSLINFLINENTFDSRVSYTNELQPIILELLQEKPNFKLLNKIISQDGNVAKSIEKFYLEYSFLDTSDYLSLLSFIGEIKNAFKDASKYWKDIEPNYSSFCDSIHYLIDNILTTIVMGSTSNEYAAFMELIKIKDGINSTPILSQHTPQYYLSRMDIVGLADINL